MVPKLRIEQSMVGEHCVGLRRCVARRAGGITRAYVDTSSENGGEKPPRRKITVNDPAKGRRILVTGQGTPNAVVWNPGSEGVKAMADLANDEWPVFVCVENAIVPL